MWNDARPVLFLTTHLRPDRNTPLAPSPGHPAISRPTVAVDYNHNKGHVDQVDQATVLPRWCKEGDGAPGQRWHGGYSICVLSTPTSCGTWSTAGRRRYWAIREELLKQIAAAYPSPRILLYSPQSQLLLRGALLAIGPRKHTREGNCARTAAEVGGSGGGRTIKCRVSAQCTPSSQLPALGLYHDRQEIDNRTL